MARLSLADIFAAIASSVNQDATSPTAGSAEWLLWKSFVNRAINEWAESHDWEELRLEYRPTISGTTQATIALPQDFKKLASAPVNYGTSVSGGEEWPEILPEQKFLLNTNAHWVQVRGDINNGYNLLWNPGTLASGTTISIQYFSTPTSLASPAQVPLLPDSQFIIDRTVGYIWEVRSDPRFQQQEAKARQRLLLMIENADLSKFSSYAGANPVLNTLQRKNFRMGRD